MENVQNIYTQNGYKNRVHYIECLAEENGVDAQTVFTLANLLGPNEDFDGLVSSVQDYAEEVHS